MERLPHQPEPVESMRARWHKAVEFAVDVEKAVADPGRAYIPSKHRRHVFDTDGGIRMIASRDKYKADGWEAIHVSFGCTMEAARRLGDKQSLIDECARLLKDVAGIDRMPDDTRETDRALHVFFNV
jgi:hypothetical protein